MVLPLSTGPLERIVCDGLPEVQSFSMSVSAEEAVRTASGSFVPVGTGHSRYLSMPTTITANGDVILTGYVRDVNTGHGESSRRLGLGFVSRTVDLVEASAVHPSGEILNKDLVGIAKELDSYGIGIESDGTSFPAEIRHKLQLGETAFASIERRARARGALLYDTPKGRLKIATKPEGIHAGSIRRGVNILSEPEATASFTEEGRYSETRIRGQQTEGSEKQHLRAQTKVTDSGVPRRRVLILPQEGEGTIDRMQQRAIWQARRAAGNGVTASIPVSGWRDENGKLWSPNWLVYVVDDWLDIEGLMIIKSVNFEQSDKTHAVLSLADPRALGGDNPRGRTGAGYAAPGVIEAEYEDE